MTDQIEPVLQGARSGGALLEATGAVLLLLDGLFQTVTGQLAELPGWLQAAGWGVKSASGLLIGAVGIEVNIRCLRFRYELGKGRRGG
jgi:hypothetical protein